LHCIKSDTCRHRTSHALKRYQESPQGRGVKEGHGCKEDAPVRLVVDADGRPYAAREAPLRPAKRQHAANEPQREVPLQAGMEKGGLVGRWVGGVPGVGGRGIGGSGMIGLQRGHRQGGSERSLAASCGGAGSAGHRALTLHQAQAEPGSSCAGIVANPPTFTRRVSASHLMAAREPREAHKHPNEHRSEQLHA